MIGIDFHDRQIWFCPLLALLMGCIVLKNELKKNETDPLEDLFQVDDINCTPKEKQALVLVGRLLENIEEYHALQAQINKVVASDPVIQSKIAYMLQTLIAGIKTEQSHLSVEFLPQL